MRLISWPLMASHMCMTPPVPAEAILFPSPDISTPVILFLVPEAPDRTCRVTPVAVSQILTVISSLPDTTVFPSRDRTTHLISSVCPFSTLRSQSRPTSRSLPTSHTRTDLSPPTEAQRFPSPEKLTLSTKCLSPYRNLTFSKPLSTSHTPILSKLPDKRRIPSSEKVKALTITPCHLSCISKEPFWASHNWSTFPLPTATISPVGEAQTEYTSP
mmetsp:Transcript_23787/g.39122  ORF Transcript_23787/g.39122 Transcript_23787/m.39122 type:complete len:215 (-) Transcript_23787:311-955(-)